MEDILSQGGDREPSRWPRRLGVIGAAALVVALGVGYLVQARHPHAPAATPPTAGGGSTARPDGVAGPAVPWADGLRLPDAGVQPTWFSPATGRSVPIDGLPADSAGYQFIRAEGGWLVRTASGGALASDDAAVPPLPVWFLADGARSVTRVGTANQVTPAATAGAVWLTTYPPSADPGTAARTAREVSVTGAPLGPPVRLPGGYAIDQATVRGLLLTAVGARPGSGADVLWDPADTKAIQTFDSVIAASPTEIAWTPACVATCDVQLLDLASGRRSAVELPAGSLAGGGAFSPGGGLLAIEVLSEEGEEPSIRIEVAPTAGGGLLTALPATMVATDTVIDFGWPTAGDYLVAEFIFPGTVQLSSWHPGARGLAVTVLRPGRAQDALVVG